MEEPELEARMAALKDELIARLEGAPYAFVDDDKRVATVLKGLIKRHETKGDDYCPCRVVSGDPEKDRKIVCPCVFMADDIERTGKCLCSLFTKR